MPQPRIPQDIQVVLYELGLGASCYQPTHLFHKNGRKLPNCAEPTDPWEVFLRREGEFGIIGKGVGATLRDALEIAIANRTGRGLLAAVGTLGEQLDLLVETISASQD